MKKRMASASLTAMVALSAAVPAKAQAPSVEQVKADSGLRFSENSGLGRASGETPAVWAGGKSGRRANLALSHPKTHRQMEVVAPKPGEPDGGNGGGSGFGLPKLLEIIGMAAGAAATSLLPVLLAGPVGLLVPVALGIAGGTAAGCIAYMKGASGWALAGSIAAGAGIGVGSLALIGGLAGDAVGRWVERLRKP